MHIHSKIFTGIGIRIGSKTYILGVSIYIIVTWIICNDYK